MDIRVPTWELGVRYFWRGVRKNKKGGSDEPPNPPWLRAWVCLDLLCRYDLRVVFV